MVLVLLKILRYPVVPDRVQKARKHKKIFSNFLRHFRNVRFRGEKVFPPVWSGLPATTCLADFMKSPKTLKINENQWFWCFSRFYGTRWYQTESRKRENIKKYFQTFSDTSETYVSEGKKSSRQSGVVYLRRPA